MLKKEIINNLKENIEKYLNGYGSKIRSGISHSGGLPGFVSTNKIYQKIMLRLLF
ncbi:MAG: hypothetical protein K0S76_1072 [Herbinix sp.]|jgi:hypothetical protein|nr:hypothetical protein [Herbinix sp.]